MTKVKDKYLRLRGSRYHYQRRLPVEFISLFKSPHIQMSLKTDSLEIARQRATAVSIMLNDYFFELGKDIEAPNAVFKQRVKALKRSGFRYIPNSDMFVQPELYDIVNRVNAASAAKTKNEKEALLGLLKEPDLLISHAADEFFEHERLKMSQMSDTEKRKYKNPVNLALKNFKKVVTNKPIGAITRSDVLLFKNWWLDRIIEDNLSPNSANRQFTNVKKSIRICNDKYELGLHLEEMFSGLGLRDDSKKERLPFMTDYIRNTILTHKYNNKTPEIKLLILAMIDTGCRIKELTGIKDEEIFLDAPVPYISIKENDVRKIKTKPSKREIPLVGTALFAFKELGGSFKHYFDKPETASAAANKYMRENGLLPTSDHTLYSFRHSFEDRLTAVEPPEKIQAQLMGHKFTREKYGQGASLEQKKKWLDKIAFDVSVLET